MSMANKITAVEWMFDKLLEEGSNGTLRWHLKYDIFKIFEQAKAMEKEQTEENTAKAITFGWELNQHHRLNTEEKLLQMQKDFITSVIKGGEK